MPLLAEELDTYEPETITSIKEPPLLVSKKDAEANAPGAQNFLRSMYPNPDALWWPGKQQTTDQSG